MGPAFNRMWAASIISNLSDGVLLAAAPLLAIALTDNTVLISAVGACVSLPWLLFAIPIGAVVDRVDRRHILATANTTRGIVVGLLALSISLDTVNIYQLMMSAFVIGTCEVASDTTSQSLIPQILDKENFEKGNSRLSISEVVVQGFIGAPMSGFLYATAIALPFFFNSVGFMVAALLALSIPIQHLQIAREKTSEPKKSFREDMKFGINYLVRDRILRRLVLTTSFIGVCYSMATATMVLFLVKELDLPKQLFGVMLTVQGIGAIIGGVVAPKASAKFGRSRVMTFGIVSSSILILLQGFAPNYFVSVALGSLGSFTISQWNILLMSTYQTVIPKEIYGRIHGTRRTLVWGLMPIGSLLGGVLAHHGLRLPMYVGGIIASVISISSVKFLLSISANSENSK
jgi:MFS family permease